MVSFGTTFFQIYKDNAGIFASIIPYEYNNIICTKWHLEEESLSILRNLYVAVISINATVVSARAHYANYILKNSIGYS